jgi:hypothetical protein
MVAPTGIAIFIEFPSFFFDLCNLLSRLTLPNEKSSTQAHRKGLAGEMGKQWRLSK